MPEVEQDPRIYTNCSNPKCRLEYAHSGPCDLPKPKLTTITTEELDKLPVLPVLVYVDNQRNRYEFRTHLGTMQQLRDMDSRDLAIVRALAEHLAQDALQIQLEEIERL